MCIYDIKYDFCWHYTCIVHNLFLFFYDLFVLKIHKPDKTNIQNKTK